MKKWWIGLFGVCLWVAMPVGSTVSADQTKPADVTFDGIGGGGFHREDPKQTAPENHQAVPHLPSEDPYDWMTMIPILIATFAVGMFTTLLLQKEKEETYWQSSVEMARFFQRSENEWMRIQSLWDSMREIFFLSFACSFIVYRLGKRLGETGSLSSLHSRKGSPPR